MADDLPSRARNQCFGARVELGVREVDDLPFAIAHCFEHEESIEAPVDCSTESGFAASKLFFHALALGDVSRRAHERLHLARWCFTNWPSGGLEPCITGTAVALG